jgi:hypothetical protein
MISSSQRNRRTPGPDQTACNCSALPSVIGRNTQRAVVSSVSRSPTIAVSICAVTSPGDSRTRPSTSPWWTRWIRSLARIDPLYYSGAHGHGYSRRRAIALVDRHGGLAAVAGPSVLRPTECVAGRPRLRSVRREAMPALLPLGHGPAEPVSRTLLPVAVARLFRGNRLGTRDRLAGDGLVGGSQFSGLGRDAKGQHFEAWSARSEPANVAPTAGAATLPGAAVAVREPGLRGSGQRSVQNAFCKGRGRRTRWSPTPRALRRRVDAKNRVLDQVRSPVAALAA